MKLQKLILDFFMHIKNNLINLLFPTACGICEKIGKNYICEDCYKKIKKEYVYRTSIGSRFYLLHYTDVIRDKMIAYKFNEKAYLHKMFFEILLKDKNACDFLKSYDIIIPVPMYKTKKMERGYNQSELVARDISNYFNIPISTKVLIKYKNTARQSTLGKEGRITNVRNVYKVQNKEKIENKNVLVIDDIYTTGATTRECKKTLKQAGANSVGIMIITRD